MSRSIDADNLDEKLRDAQYEIIRYRGGYRYLSDEDKHRHDALERMIELVSAAPTIDAAPVGASALYANEVDHATVGQYTGLMDKHGKRIFEGDIVTGRFAGEYINGHIIYGSDATYFIDRDGLYGIGLDNAQDWIEVIGNIHDNPELLEATTCTK